jgi:putative membrane protein
MKGIPWASWSLDPAVLAGLAVAGFAYGRGVRTLWRHAHRRGVAPWHVVSFAGGLVALCVALVSPLHAVATELLWAHMVQHVLLVLAAAPLLVLGAPVLPMSVAIPAAWRRRVRSWGHVEPLRSVRLVLTWPIVAWLLHVAVMWMWHVPSIYQAATTNSGLHAVEHASFLATALLFWWVAIPSGGRRRLGGGTDVLYVFTGGIQSGVLGALFTFAGAPLYPVYAHTALRWGTSPLQDQQLAGLIMWIPGGLVYVFAAGVLFVRWLLMIERESRKAEGRTGSIGILGEQP